MSLDEKKIVEDILKSWKVPEGMTKEDSWMAIQEKLKHPSTPVVSIRKSRVWAYAAAAAVIIALLWWRVGVGGESTISTFTESLVIELPDGSYAHLNASSSISYAEGDWDTIREVYLQGEAYFDVKTGSKFTVKTEHGTVEVLGTEFNVFAREEGFGVSCFEGMVRVENQDSGVVLSPGTKTAELEGKLADPENFDLSLEIWTKGVFNWENADLVEVFKEIERQYGVEVSLPDLSNRKFSGSFNKTELHIVLSLVCESMGLNYTINSGESVSIQHR